MAKADNVVFWVLRVIAWIIFIGLSIEAGALLTNFVFAAFKPEVVGRLYLKLDLSEMHARSEAAFFGMYGFMLAIAFLKVVLFYRVVMMVTKIDLSKPFSTSVSRQIRAISYYSLAIGLLSYLAKACSGNLAHKGFATASLDGFWGDGEAFLFMAAVIHIIAVIFRKGLELQNENDLTV